MIAATVSLLFSILPGQIPSPRETPQATALVSRYASHYNVPPELVSAIIDVESSWDTQALSNKGAMGLTQIMPDTARRFGASHPYDPEENIAAGTRYLALLMSEFHGDMRLVAAAYYAGDRWVFKRRLNFRNPMVVAYVEAVRARYIRRTILSASYLRKNQ